MNNSSTVIVATYNMSFMSDLTTPLKDAQWASETTFLSSLPKHPNHRRDYWMNAKNHLKTFLMENIKENIPCVVGLQEMNLTNGDILNNNTGSASIDLMLSKLPIKTYIQVCKEIEVKSPSGVVTKPALSIIFDTNIFGKEKYSNIYDNPLQSGRPLLIVITDKNYVFINLHGAQDIKLGLEKQKFNDSILNFNSFVKPTIETFIKEKITDISQIKNIFITGDFNDRFDAIRDFNILDKNLKYNGESPYSCCHNWNSSCVNSRFDKFTDYSTNRYSKTEIGTCMSPTYPIVDEKNIKLPMPGEEGFINNYRFKGDKVFGEQPVSEMQIYRDTLNKRSTESDHELVYAKFTISQSGGRKTRKISKSNKNKNKKTRKN